MSTDNTPTGTPTLIGLLGLLFLGLKLAHVITWSWWLVLLPFYGVILLSAGATEAVRAAKRRRALAKARSNPAAGSGRRISITERRNSR